VQGAKGQERDAIYQASRWRERFAAVSEARRFLNPAGKLPVTPAVKACQRPDDMARTRKVHSQVFQDATAVT
jgi:hypothetical protein